MEDDRADVLAQKFKEQPFAQFYKMRLDCINRNEVVVSMPVHDGMWTDKGIANGLTLGPLANAAGVFLAMMHSRFFTPLSEVKELVFLRPTLKEEDNTLIAIATVMGKTTKNFEKGPLQVIEISVEVSAMGGKTKAHGIFEYVLLQEEYKK